MQVIIERKELENLERKAELLDALLDYKPDPTIAGILVDVNRQVLLKVLGLPYLTPIRTVLK